MEPITAVIVSVPPTIAALAAWMDMRKRTNGSGPLAEKLDQHGDRLGRIETRIANVETRLVNVEHRHD